MDLLIKNLVAVAIMTAIHYISKTKNYYISGLALSFPGLSIVAYYFMYMDYGADKVKQTTTFAMLSVVPFAIFLLVLHLAVKRESILFSFLMSAAVWGTISLLLVFGWQKYH